LSRGKGLLRKKLGFVKRKRLNRKEKKILSRGKSLMKKRKRFCFSQEKIKVLLKYSGLTRRKTYLLIIKGLNRKG
jgi:hypothetical protein